MPQMNFDLEDGQPPVSFSLKEADVLRFVVFMSECTQAIRDAREAKSTRLYTVPVEVEEHDVLYRLQDHPEPRSDCGVVYTQPQSVMAVLEQAAQLVKLQLGGRAGELLADEIRSLVVSPGETVNSKCAEQLPTHIVKPGED